MFCRSGLRSLLRQFALLLFVLVGLSTSEDVVRLSLSKHSRKADAMRANSSGTHPAFHADDIRDSAGGGSTDLLVPSMMLDVLTRRFADVQDQFYTIDVQIGTPRQKARLIVDTGSSDMWVKPSVYRRKKSSTSKVFPSSPMLITYGAGTLGGVQVKDDVCLGSLCAADQYFILATHISGIANGDYFDGVMGFGGPALFLEPEGTPIVSEFLANVGRHKAFAFCLSSQDKPSFVSFGSVSALESEAKILGFAEKNSLQVQTLNGNFMYWMLPLAVSTGTDVLSGVRILPTKVFGILDSGTSLLAVPASVFPVMLNAILGRDSVIDELGQCKCSVQLNPIYLTFATLDNKELHITLTKDDLLRQIGVDGNNDPLCRLNVMSAGVIPFWILGDVFLRKAYVIHDVNHQQVILMTHKSLETNLEASPASFKLPLALVALALLVSIVSWLGMSLLKGQYGFRQKMHAFLYARTDVQDGDYSYLAA